VILLLYVFWPAIPQFKYPFILFFITFFSYEILINRRLILNNLKKYIRAFSLVLFLVTILFLAILFSNKLYISVLKEAIEVLVLLLIFFLLTLIVSSRSKLNIFVSNLVFNILVFSILIAIINTYVFIELQKHLSYYPANNYHKDLYIGSLLIDNNFALLPVFFGIVILIFKLNKNITRIERIGYNLILLFFSLHILLSSSRRGLIVLVIFILFLIIIRLCVFVNKCLIVKTLVSNIRLYYLSIFIIPVFLVSFVRFGSYDFKVKSLKFIGIDNVSSLKTFITSTLYGHVSRFKKDISYYQFNKVLWSTTFNPKDPDNGWGFGYYKTIYPLQGVNVNMVPEGSIGYLLDNSCSIGNSNHHAYSSTLIYTNRVSDNNIVNASVYCYVDTNFNGDFVCIRSDGDTYGQRVSQYDLGQKGTWQKLSLSASCHNGNAEVSLYFNKEGVTNFSRLRGRVIFAYPQYETTSKTTNQNLIFFVKPEQSGGVLSAMPIVDELGLVIPGNHGLLQIKESNILTLDFYNYNSFRLLLPFMQSLDSSLIGKNKIVNWMKGFIKEDTIYYSSRTNLKVDTISKLFFDDRLSRWQFSLKIFKSEYNWSKKLFGGGFNFLNWYGYYFYGDKRKSDYPHNPFLHILLYSGIIGLILYFILLYKVFYYYLKYSNGYNILFTFFLITFFFTFFSGGNPFDPPIMGFFILLPFFVHSVLKNAVSDKSEVNYFE
jgi:hypothetical protein